MHEIFKEKYLAMEPGTLAHLVAMQQLGVVVPGAAPTLKEPEMRAIENYLTPRELGWMGIGLQQVSGKNIAVLEISGGTYNWYTNWLAQRLAICEGNALVAGVVLAISSPGGTVNGCWELADAIAEMKKPVVAHASYMAASCGYLFASQCDEIFVNDSTTRLGSIGVMQAIVSYAGQLEKEGIKAIVQRSSGAEAKNVLHPYEPLDEADPKVKAAIEKEQAFLDAVGNRLWAMVRRGRPHVKRELGAELYMGKECKENGLADAMGSLSAAIARAAYLALRGN